MVYRQVALYEVRTAAVQNALEFTSHPFVNMCNDHGTSASRAVPCNYFVSKITSIFRKLQEFDITTAD